MAEQVLYEVNPREENHKLYQVKTLNKFKNKICKIILMINHKGKWEQFQEILDLMIE
jgi:hypothetical protein